MVSVAYGFEVDDVASASKFVRDTEENIYFANYFKGRVYRYRPDESGKNGFVFWVDVPRAIPFGYLFCIILVAAILLVAVGVIGQIGGMAMLLLACGVGSPVLLETPRFWHIVTKYRMKKAGYMGEYRATKSADWLYGGVM